MPAIAGIFLYATPVINNIAHFMHAFTHFMQYFIAGLLDRKYLAAGFKNHTTNKNSHIQKFRSCVNQFLFF